MTGLPKVTVVIPTIPGRETHFRRCRDSYIATTDGVCVLDLVIVVGEPTCGWGWQAGIEKMAADSEYLHLTCDDIEAQPGWVQAAVSAITDHVLPAPRILNGTTGAPESFPQWGYEWADGTEAGLSALPFMSRDLFENHVAPMLTSHYYGDNWVTWRAGLAGYPALVRRGYFFKHHWASHRRGAGMEYGERLKHDGRLFQQAAGMVQRGEWVKPWPDRDAVT
jgi:hypothetical protein